MLVQLAIRDIVLIDRLDIPFERGLTVLTGETGAGKSILLDAFALALGGRGDGGLVRAGQKQGQVTAVFDLAADHPARALAATHDIDVDGDLILRRVQVADGRTRAFVNDQPISVQALRALGAALVEIHGQHDDRALMDAATHRSILDAFGGLQGLAAACAAASSRYGAARQALSRQVAAVEAARGEADFLRYAVEELDGLKPEPGEEAALAAERQAMQAAQKVTVDLQEAFDAVAGDRSPVPEVAAALRKLERRASHAPELMDPPTRALALALDAIEDARTTLLSALRDAEFDPRRLDACEERLFALRAAARKFGVLADDLAAKADEFRTALEALDAGEGALKHLTAEEGAARAAYREAALALSAKRKEAAAALDAAVNAELPPLRLERARFTTRIETDEGALGPDGFDAVEFWVQTNPGTRPGPMTRVASGGELSRFMLALKVVAADRGSAPTLVFDEIDTGVGGAVADAIGQRLARLAERVQVVSVTHAPQVAARAATHLLIAKEIVPENAEERVATRVGRLKTAQRREEIARMLAGASVTDEARAAAGRLLDAASDRAA